MKTPDKSTTSPPYSPPTTRHPIDKATALVDSAAGARLLALAARGIVKVRRFVHRGREVVETLPEGNR
jgi:hypothetical protein